MPLSLTSLSCFEVDILILSLYVNKRLLIAGHINSVAYPVDLLIMRKKHKPSQEDVTLGKFTLT
jgi:hypothetical protein